MQAKHVNSQGVIGTKCLSPSSVNVLTLVIQLTKFTFSETVVHWQNVLTLWHFLGLFCGLLL